MTASSALVGKVVPDVERLAYGTFTGADTAAFTIATGFSVVRAFSLEFTSVGRAYTHSISGGTITVTVASGSSDAGIWWAIGH